MERGDNQNIWDVEGGMVLTESLMEADIWSSDRSVYFLSFLVFSHELWRHFDPQSVLEKLKQKVFFFF